FVIASGSVTAFLLVFSFLFQLGFHIMGHHRSDEDDVHKISTSIFVTNFPDQFSAKDLWKACSQYGRVTYAFIPNRRAISGKRFGFMRFTKTFDMDRLVNNLCTYGLEVPNSMQTFLDSIDHL
ncbi:nucleotide-binding alpha-beta plait domain-containing protein, partial [Tanacetum coccineum]